MSEGLVCLSVMGQDPDELAALVAPVADRIDLVEVRLDGMAVPDVRGCLERIGRPLLFTNRPVWEGGGFAGDEEQRLEPLLDAVRSGAAFVDLELRADTRLRDRLLAEIGPGQTRLILSWHDFQGTPPADKLNEILTRMHSSGAHIGKIVTTARTPADTVRTLALLGAAADLRFPLSCFCMGGPGRISRLASLYLGGCMSYVTATADRATAPGQLTAAQLHQLRDILDHAH